VSFRLHGKFKDLIAHNLTDSLTDRCDWGNL